MGLDTLHPQYARFSESWVLMRDCFEGETRVKEKGEVYLPATSGMHLDGMKPGQEGYKAYDAYRKRAVFHDYVKDAISVTIGLLHRKPPTIELPPQLEPLREKATVHGESLELLLRRINEEQLIVGRVGLMADLPAEPDPANPLPYLALYTAESVINWDDGSFRDGFNSLNLVVLNETGWKRTEDFTWEIKEKFRVLQLGELTPNEQDATYYQGVFEGTQYSEASMFAPTIRGQTLQEIPFVFINSQDIVAEPAEPPLVGLGRLTMAIYRGEADYRQNLYMQGQDTLVVIGGITKAATDIPGQAPTLRVGAGSRIDIEQGGDAKYVGVSSNGLMEQRMCLATDKERAMLKAGQFVRNTGMNRESGEAMRIRMTAQTATLNEIAISGAAGLEQILKTIAKWIGADPEKVKVKANTEFIEFEMNGQEIVQLMTARAMGAPVSLETIHTLMQERGITTKTLEEEAAAMEKEQDLLPPIGGINTNQNFAGLQVPFTEEGLENDEDDKSKDKAPSKNVHADG